MEKKKKQEQAEVAPQLSFTEQEHSDLIEFINLMNEAKFECDLKKAHRAAMLHIKAVNLCRKIESHILEVKRVIKAKDSQ